MKIDINLTGTDAAPADFDLLRAALVAAQAATPTARAALGPAAAAAVPTFADLLTDIDAAVALAHRFAADPAGAAR